METKKKILLLLLSFCIIPVFGMEEEEEGKTEPKTLEDVVKELKSAEEELDKSRAALITLEKEALDEFRKTHKGQDLTDNLNKSRNEFSELQEEEKKLKSQLSELKEEEKKLKSQPSKLQEEEKKLKSQLSELQEKKDNLKREIKTYEDQQEKVSEKMKTTREEIQKKAIEESQNKEMIENLKKQVESQMKEIEKLREQELKRGEPSKRPRFTELKSEVPEGKDLPEKSKAVLKRFNAVVEQLNDAAELMDWRKDPTKKRPFSMQAEIAALTKFLPDDARSVAATALRTALGQVPKTEDFEITVGELGKFRVTIIGELRTRFDTPRKEGERGQTPFDKLVHGQTSAPTDLKELTKEQQQYVVTYIRKHPSLPFPLRGLEERYDSLKDEHDRILFEIASKRLSDEEYLEQAKKAKARRKWLTSAPREVTAKNAQTAASVLELLEKFKTGTISDEERYRLQDLFRASEAQKLTRDETERLKGVGIDIRQIPREVRKIIAQARTDDLMGRIGAPGVERKDPKGLVEEKKAPAKSLSELQKAQRKLQKTQEAEKREYAALPFLHRNRVLRALSYTDEIQAFEKAEAQRKQAQAELAAATQRVVETERTKVEMKQKIHRAPSVERKRTPPSRQTSRKKIRRSR
ncbi:hypothetical protein ACFLY6_00600 [Candidatus Dependentiae bacterium]